MHRIDILLHCCFDRTNEQLIDHSFIGVNMHLLDQIDRRCHYHYRRLYEGVSVCHTGLFVA